MVWGGKVGLGAGRAPLKRVRESFHKGLVHKWGGKSLRKEVLWGKLALYCEKTNNSRRRQKSGQKDRGHNGRAPRKEKGPRGNKGVPQRATHPRGGVGHPQIWHTPTPGGESPQEFVARPKKKRRASVKHRREKAHNYGGNEREEPPTKRGGKHTHSVSRQDRNK